MMKESVKGYLLCLFGVFTWSFSELIVVILADTVGATSLTFYRFFFGGLFCFLIMALQKDTKGTTAIFKKNKRLVLIASMFGLGFSNILYFLGTAVIGDAGVSAAIYTSYPLFICIYGALILGEKSNMPRKLIGLVIGFTGVLILITNFNLLDIFGSKNILGKLLVLLGAGIWSLYSVLGKKIFQRTPEVSNIEIKWTTLSFLLSCVPTLIILTFTPELGSFFQHSLFSWSLIAFLAVFGSALGLYAFFVGIKKIEVTHGISLALLKPIMASILSFFILGKVPQPALYVSIPLVSIAVILINWKGKREKIETVCETELEGYL
ncbi:MAG: DMT family transporter [Candidatus Hodarchaeota archaeon]